MTIAAEIDDILTAFAERRFKMELTDIAVKAGNQTVLRCAHGELISTPQKKLLLKFNAPQLPGRFPLDMLGSDAGFDITAKGPNGWHFSTFLFALLPMEHLGEGMVSWRAETLIAYLSRGANSTPSELKYFGLIDELDYGFENGSVKVNEHGRESQSLDWLQIPAPGVTTIVRRGEKGWSTVEIEMDDVSARDRYHLEIRATLNGLGLRMGRRLDHFCAYSKYPESEVICMSAFNFSRPPHTGNQPLIPLLLDKNVGSSFIALAKEFFIKNTDQRMFDLLYSIWDAELVSRENHRLQMAIGLEAMASLVNKMTKDQPKSQIEQEISEDDDKFYKTRDDAVKLLETLKGEPGHITRLKNVVKRTGANDSGPKIEGAAASLGLTFAKKETQLWREMRHSAAHGEAKDFDGKETDFFACQSMLYRLVLKLIGWDGPRQKYSEFDRDHVPYRSSKPVVQVFKTSEIKNLRRVVKPDE